MGQINFARGEDKGFTPLPEGDYDVKIMDVEETTSQKGNAQLKISIEIMDGPYASKSRPIWYSLLPQATWKLKELTDAIGIEWQDTGETDAENNPIFGFDTDELIGRCVRFRVVQREYQGKSNNDFNAPVLSDYDTEAGAASGEDADEAAGDGEAEAAPEPEPKAAAKPAAGVGRRPRPAAR